MSINLEKSAKGAQRFDLEKDAKNAKATKVTLKKKVTLKAKTPQNEVSNKFVVFRTSSSYDTKSIVTLDIDTNKEAQCEKYNRVLPENVRVRLCCTAKERSNIYYVLSTPEFVEVDGQKYELCYYQRDLAKIFGLEVNHKRGASSRLSLEQKAEKLAMQLQEVQQAIAAEKKAKAEREERKAIEDKLRNYTLAELKELLNSKK